MILFSTTTPAQQLLLLKLFRIISKHRNKKVTEDAEIETIYHYYIERNECRTYQLILIKRTYNCTHKHTYTHNCKTMEITNQNVDKLKKQIKDLRNEIRKIDTLLLTEEQFQKDVLDVLKDEKAKLILLKKQSDPMTKLVLLRLKGKTTLRTIEDLIYTTFDMEHLEKYLLQLKTILLQLSQHSKLFTRHMMYEDFKQMDWDVGSLRQLQRVLDPNGHLYIGSNVENKILSILDYLYDGTSLHFKMKKNNNKNNMLCYKKMTSTNNNKTKRRRGRTLRRSTRRNSIA